MKLRVELNKIGMDFDLIKWVFIKYFINYNRYFFFKQLNLVFMRERDSISEPPINKLE